MRLKPGLAAVFAIITVVVAAGTMFYLSGNWQDAEAASLEHLADTSLAVRQDITDELANGGSLTIVRERYQRDRYFDPERVPPPLRYPDRVVEEIELTVDTERQVTELSITTRSLDGEVLGRTERLDDRAVTTAPTGESYEFPAGLGTFSLIDWLDSSLAAPSRLEQRAFEPQAASELHGRQSTVLEAEFDPQRGPQLHRTYEFVNQNPLYFRSAGYKIQDGQEVLVREIIILDIVVEPTSEE